jgi:NodT family efflux transporter outer membrane factor (OMF) lipoprotein
MRFLLVLLLLGACALRPPDRGPGPATLGRFAENGEAAAGWPGAGWWEGFGSAELDRFVKDALAANTDLAAAAARLRQADAQVRIAGAGLLPTLEADAGGGATRTSSEARPLGGGPSISNSYDAGLRAAWELDLWGRNRAALVSARASAAADLFDRDGVALTVASGVADTYFQVLSTRDRLRIAQANLDNARRVLQLVEVRVADGAATPLELAQQRTQVATQSATIPSLRQQERQAVNALALLLARPLDGFEVEAQSSRDLRPVPVQAGLPSDLLQRRPDIAAAEARLDAAAADVTAARTALYPSLNLTANAGVESNALRAILSRGNVISIGLSALAPIFEGGRLRAQVELSEAQRLELIEAYRGSVLEALADVEDALNAVRRTREREAALATAATEARRAFALAEAQYRAGAIGLLELLDTQRTLFSTEDSLASARFDRLSGLADLYRALGGGWSEESARPGP